MAAPQKVSELKKNDSRLGEELTAALSNNTAWQAMYGRSDPSYVWALMNQERPAGAIAFYAEMEEKDDHYSAQVETRREAVTGKPWRVQPASESARDARIAEFVEHVFGEMPDFENVLNQMLDCLGKGVSIGEILYDVQGREIVIRDVAFRPQQHFAFGELGAAQNGALRVAGDVELPVNKFVVCTFQSYLCNRWGRPLGRRCFWPAWFKRQTVKFWLKAVEKGSGTVLVKYRPGAEAAEQALALEAAIKINDETAVAVMADFQVEMLQQARPANPAVFAALAEKVSDNAISKIVLGQVLTSAGSSDGSGSRALGEVHNEVRQEKVERDARMLVRCVERQMIRPLVTLNFGGVEIPRFIIEAEQGDDLGALAKTYSTMVGFGLPIPLKHALDRFQIPQAEEGEELLRMPASAPAPPDPNKQTEFAEGDPEPVAASDAGVEQAAPLYGAIASRLMALAIAAFPEEADDA